MGLKRLELEQELLQQLRLQHIRLRRLEEEQLVELLVEHVIELYQEVAI
jgi:hypothetical protein